MEVDPTLRSYVETTKKLGLSKKERRDTRTQFNYSKEEASPDLQRMLSNEMVLKLLGHLGGSSGDQVDKRLTRLGNVLYEWGHSGQSGKKPNEADKEIISLGSDLIEKALYQGTLTKLSSADAAHLAFLANRVAKLQAGKRGRQFGRFDEERLRELMFSIDQFANEVFDEKKIEKRGKITKAKENGVSMAVPLAGLKNDASRVKDARAQYSESEDAASEAIWKKPATAGMYFVKHLLIASDLLKRGEPLVGEFEAKSKAQVKNKDKTMAVHDFLQRNSRDRSSSASPWHSFHYREELMQFFKFSAAYLSKYGGKTESDARENE